MSNPMTKRIQKEFREFKEIVDCNISLTVEPDNFTELIGHIGGPPDSVYEGGIFDVKVNITKGYPFDPPKVKFLTRIWHPNISSVTGVICLDILTPRGWSAVLTIRSLLLSVQALLVSPEPDDPQDAIVASQFKSCKSIFDDTARFWTMHYAKGKGNFPQKFAKMVSDLMGKGYSEESCVVALSESNWMLDKGLRKLESNRIV